MNPQDPRFSATARLYGSAALERFTQAHVAVVGIGGVGTWAVEALARSGIGRLTLVDLDEVCLTNTNRQLHALEGQIGRPKTSAMADRIRAIHPACQVEEIHAFLRKDNAADILDRGFDVVIDAIDTVRHKALLLARCHHRGTPTVCAGGAGGRRDPTRIHSGDLAHSFGDPLLLAVRRELRGHHGFPKAESGSQPQAFGIRAVFSDEPQAFPQCDGSVGPERDPSTSLRLDCQSGYGTTAAVTGAFGLAAAAQALELLLE